MAKKDLRTEQEISPHRDLVAVRNTVQECCKVKNEEGKNVSVSRRQAAAMCNLLFDKECDDIITAGKDADKVQKIATRVQRAEEARAEKEEIKAAKAKKSRAEGSKK